MRAPAGRREAGFTFAEMAFAMLILVIGAVVLINHISVNFSTTATERDRVFAYSKAQAILSEIQAYVDRGDVEAAIDLDVLDDGAGTRNTLTIQTQPGTGEPGVGTLVLADHVVSGNYQRNGNWVWSRRIQVQPFVGLNNRNVRYVTVRVFKRDKFGNENPMADLSAVINSSNGAFPTTQVYDVYLLAVENIPGWWVFMDAIKPFVESMITDLENRNPGLSFRTHWITKASFGRNQTYRPYTNADLDSHEVIPDVYHYPGRMPDGNASSYYYVPDNIKARINVDGEEENGYDATTNPHPYALADFFNHGMRYPEEKALWEQRVAEVIARQQAITAAEQAGSPPPAELDDMSAEPTLRLLLEDLNSDPDKYKNALVVNLHGELLPMPALRNFSDAAKDPVNHPGWRVVTHPEELRTRKDDGGVTDPLRFRVYAYTDLNYTGPDRMDEPMIVDVMGVDLIDHSDADGDRLVPQAELEFLAGGVPVAGDDTYSDWDDATHLDDVTVPSQEMYYLAQFVSGSNPHTRIYLYNTPLECPLVDGKGLADTERAQLYRMEYIPSPVSTSGGAPEFTRDLFTTDSVGPKNTARWTLELDPALLTSDRFVQAGGATYNPTGDVLMSVRTRIASDLSSGGTAWLSAGTVYPSPVQADNLSTTYAWWSDSREDVPFTERAQFNGDPRHLPYKDCFHGGDDFPDAYNWYHDALDNGGEDATADFTSIDRARVANLWEGAMWCDVPRYFELLRNGIVESACVYTSMTGFSNYYIGIGNDIGYDASNGYPLSIPCDLTPHQGSGAGYINTITAPRKLAMTYLSGYGWWSGMPWLGELYPDAMASAFHDASSGSVRGNLPAGGAVGQVFQYASKVAYQVGSRQAYGTALNNHHQRSGVKGCSTFFNIGTSTTSFRHLFRSGDATLTTIGQEVADNYSMTMPATAPVSRPFVLNGAGGGGSQWNLAPYNARYTGSLLETYYQHSSGTGSGLVKLTNPSSSSAGYVVVNGIDRSVASGSSFIAKWAVLSLVHSFLEAGEQSNTLRIQQTPRIEIDSPTDITELVAPSEIDVLFGVDWTRWDGQPYTLTGSYSEDEGELEYVLMYSNDNGLSYYYLIDDAPATPGVRPTNPLYIESDGVVGDETFTWSVPLTEFPEGSYLLRVECFRQGAQVHYAWHQTRIYIQR